jgi:hypothetical protein
MAAAAACGQLRAQPLHAPGGGAAGAVRAAGYHWGHRPAGDAAAAGIPHGAPARAPPRCAGRGAARRPRRAVRWRHAGGGQQRQELKGLCCSGKVRARGGDEAGGRGGALQGTAQRGPTRGAPCKCDARRVTGRRARARAAARGRRGPARALVVCAGRQRRGQQAPGAPGAQEGDAGAPGALRPTAPLTGRFALLVHRLGSALRDPLHPWG